MAGGDGMGPMAMAPPHGSGHAPTGRMPPPPPAGSQHMSMMHMTFFWGDRAVVLFPGWPGSRGAAAYVLCLLFVLALAALTEALAAASRYVARRGSAAAGRVPASSAALLTAAHAARMGTAYLVMLAVMSFNGGVLLAAVAGHALGFLLARSRVHPGGGAGAAAAAAAPRDRELAHAPDGSKA
ncbi:hypothetical protein BAE44_0026190 [Dichanthelium oligosanthes]|uniref:Copper transport protein n=1 Tax=Dichanthelium oligosanthes TaxID=888268 RepID=A0A1E5UIS8_9POAL|nr:hypothetical protein BAE44_0026190 [Dichanthelium oligosanthes]